MIVVEAQVREWLAEVETGRSMLSPDEQLAEIARLREGGPVGLATALDTRLAIAEADAFARIGHAAEAIAVLQRVTEGFAESEDEPTLKAVAYALMIRVKLLSLAGQRPEAEADAQRLTGIFERLRPRTPRRVQVGRMLIDAAFWMFAFGSRAQAEAIVTVMDSFARSDNPDEQQFAAAGALFTLLLRGHAGELEGLRPYVQNFARFGSNGLPALDQVQRLFGEPSLNPAFHASLEGWRAVLLDALSRRDEALDSLRRAEQIYGQADISEGLALVAWLREDWE